jgi:ABC-type uncharacterized transport system involved in gliding motility auxiliary subunit
VTAFFQEGSPEAEEAKDLLEQYAYACRKFSFEFVDPDRFPAKARRYGITAYGTLVMETETREEKLAQTQEQKLTNALLRVTRKGQKVMYFMTGHDEKSTQDQGKDGYSAVKEAVEEQNYIVKDLLLMRAEEVPTDTSVLIIAGPKKNLFSEEMSSLRAFVDKGGHVLILVDPETDTGLAAFLRSYGIVVGQDIIVDKMSRIFGADYLTPIVSEYDGYHPVTEDFKAASFFPLARSVRKINDVPEHVNNTELAKTGTSSWAETNLKILKEGSAFFDEKKDSMGPVPVAVVSTINRKVEEPEDGGTEEPAGQAEDFHDRDDKDGKDAPRPARIVVFGDSDFAGNAYLNLSGNRDLFMNALSLLAEEQDLIAIRPKERESQPMVLSHTQGRIIFWSSVVLLPGAVLVLGVMVLRARRLTAS